MSHTLKPCPYDGTADLIIGETIENEDIVGGHIRCHACGALITADSVEDAVVLWNTRASAPPEPATDAIRFHPGHGMTVDTGSGGGGIDGWEDQILSIASYPQWSFCVVLLNWDDIEPAVRGTYSRDILDRLMNACRSAGKRLVIGIKFQWFGNPTSVQGKLPAYLDTIENGKPGYSLREEGEDPWSGNLSLYVHLHDERVMDCYLGVVRFVAQCFADDDDFLMLSFGESAVDAPDSSGFTTQKWYDQQVRYAKEARAVFPQTELRMGTNYLGDEYVMRDFMEDLDVYDIADGGPDNYSRSYHSNLVLVGEVDEIDRRGSRAWVSENQRPTDSSGGDDTTSAEVTEHNTRGPESEGGSTQPHYWIWSKTYNWPEVRDHVIDIDGETNTVNPHANHQSQAQLQAGVERRKRMREKRYPHGLPRWHRTRHDQPLPDT